MPFIYYYKTQVDSYNKIIYNILTKEMPLILPAFKKEKTGILTTLVTGFIGLAYQWISSCLHNKRKKALQKAFNVMERKVNLERNKNFHLEDSMMMYSITMHKQ